MHPNLIQNSIVHSEIVEGGLQEIQVLPAHIG
jgi:hypothetical protein